MSWATFGDLERVRRFATESVAVQKPTPLNDAFRRIYELRRWTQQELERNHAEKLRVESLVLEINEEEVRNKNLSNEIYQLEDTVAELEDSIASILKDKEAAEESRRNAEQLRVERLVLEIDQQETLNDNLSQEICQLEDTVAELEDSIAGMLQKKKDAEESRKRILAERTAERIRRARIEESKQKSKAESDAIIAWARKAPWSELDQFILRGKAKGFPVSTVDRLVEVHTNRRWHEEDKVRRIAERRDSEIREQTIKQIVRKEFKEIHEELSAFTTEYVLAMSGSEFESFVARMFRAFGYRSEVVGGGLDEGIDVSIWLDDSLFGVAQCKRYADKNISASQVRDFIGAYMATDAKKAFFFTTSDFTRAAREAARDFGGLDLYDLDDVKTFVTNARKRIERRDKMSI